MAGIRFWQIAISIHALRGEGDNQQRESPNTEFPFQSTPSVGRATIPTARLTTRCSFQSTPSVGRATDMKLDTLNGSIDFNPRPPWGGRLNLSRTQENAEVFQSTPSVGRATADKATTGIRIENFNPRPPWGGRPHFSSVFGFSTKVFQSTPSVGRATVTAIPKGSTLKHFNPRPPWGGRPATL